jgi:hypothetical protein
MIGKRGVKILPSPHDTSGGGSAVTNMSNADGSLTVSPTIGAVVASLNVANANTWTADQTFTDNTKVTLGTGGDADIYYDGIDLIINSRVAGSGNTLITGDIMPDADSTYDFGTNTVRWTQSWADFHWSLAFRSTGNNSGTTGSFTDESSTPQLVTVTNGIITNIVNA